MITISPWRSTKCSGGQAPALGAAARAVRGSRPRSRAGTNTDLPDVPSTNPAARISIAPIRLVGTIRRTAPKKSGSPRRCQGGQRKVHDRDEQEGGAEEHAVAAEDAPARRARRRTSRSSRRGRPQGRRPARRRRCSSARRTTPTSTTAPPGSAARAPGRATSDRPRTRVVTCVNANTKTRSRNSSSGVIRCSSSKACSLMTGGYPGGARTQGRSPMKNEISPSSTLNDSTSPRCTCSGTAEPRRGLATAVPPQPLNGLTLCGANARRGTSAGGARTVSRSLCSRL